MIEALAAVAFFLMMRREKQNERPLASLLVHRAPYQVFLEDNFKEKMDLIEQCVECGQCRCQCPYHLDAPNLLKRELKRYQEFYETHAK